MDCTMKIKILKILKYFSLAVVALFLILIAYYCYVFFIAKDFELDITGIDLDREVPAESRDVIPIDADDFINIVNHDNYDGYFIQVWSMMRNCKGSGCLISYDFAILDSLQSANEKIKFMLLSYDLNHKNIIKGIKLDLYDKGFNSESYILDYSIDFADMTQKSNLYEFFSDINPSLKNRTIYDYKLSQFYNIKGKLVKEFDSLDFKEIDNYLNSEYKTN
jgi:hypothetical protein